jgi:hypothetical protein
MSTPQSINALRRANPRNEPGFELAVEALAQEIESVAAQPAVSRAPARQRRSLRFGLVALAGTSIAVIALLLVSSPEDVSASAAIRSAATATASSAEKSGTAVLRITHNGEPWAATSVRWHDDDVAISRPGRAGAQLLVVGGVMYGVDPGDGKWVVLGPVSSIDPGSGTTPAEYRTAVKEDLGGVTLRRLTTAMTGLTTSTREDGSSVYNGKVAAGLIARETGFKEGQRIRVFPFGYVAHDEAANPRAALDTAVVVNTEGIVSEITVTWGHASSFWKYTIAYSNLGETAALVAPADARPLVRSTS